MAADRGRRAKRADCLDLERALPLHEVAGVNRAVLVCLALAGCAAGADLDLDEPQDAEPGDDSKSDAPRQTCKTVRCGNPEADVILFPGNLGCTTGCERNLASNDVYVPPTNSRPWGDTFEEGTWPARVLAGYSSGRIALLRRLAFFDDGEHAIMLDPSWEDGARDFLGDGPVRGATIVADWLRSDESRLFTLIYSKRSVGWSSYVALQTTDVGDRVRVCAVTEAHMLVPKVRDLQIALADPLAWDNGTCKWGELP